MGGTAVNYAAADVQQESYLNINKLIVEPEGETSHSNAFLYQKLTFKAAIVFRKKRQKAANRFKILYLLRRDECGGK